MRVEESWNYVLQYLHSKRIQKHEQDTLQLRQADAEQMDVMGHDVMMDHRRPAIMCSVKPRDTYFDRNSAATDYFQSSCMFHPMRPCVGDKECYVTVMLFS